MGNETTARSSFTLHKKNKDTHTPEARLKSPTVGFDQSKNVSTGTTG